MDTTPYISLDLDSVPTQRKNRSESYRKLKKISKNANPKSPQVARRVPELRASVRGRCGRYIEMQHDTNPPKSIGCQAVFVLRILKKGKKNSI